MEVARINLIIVFGDGSYLLAPLNDLRGGVKSGVTHIIGGVLLWKFAYVYYATSVAIFGRSILLLCDSQGLQRGNGKRRCSLDAEFIGRAAVGGGGSQGEVVHTQLVGD